MIKLAHERGGIAKAAGAMISPPAPPRDHKVLVTLRIKYPTDDPPVIATSKAWLEQLAGLTSVGEQKQASDGTTGSLDAYGQIPEMENLFEEAPVKVATIKATPESAAGPSGLRYSHLQAALCDELVEHLAAFTTLLVSSRISPQVLWTLHTSAHRSALGKTSRPVAYFDVFQRVMGTVYYCRYGRKLTDYFQPWGEYGTAVSGGVETMAFTATLRLEEGCTSLSYDAGSTFNNIYGHRL